MAAVYCDPSEPGLMAELNRHLTTHKQLHDGCKLRAHLVAANNDVMPGLMAVDKAIRSAMLVSPACQGLLSEMPAYTWAPSKAGGFHERPIDIHDDACDALRYAVMAFEPDPTNPWAAVAGKQVTA